ncbi:hypothetical protein PR202_gb25356 [Eleusine coracana subsp. coracana]|uniref:Uncharacterized protein n=1 Tax=Eleusine coracana subsp. coracana TaxID=191504 RepID=A0AAV5FPT6_ELECO|nr:hypothetical protein PR202_gb25311 [Eleusine coracana subsp. coracana]GJN36493.1 hypothetical protein PR202_gb25356 [Eleusine coracana subsp. coracana]
MRSSSAFPLPLEKMARIPRGLLQNGAIGLESSRMDSYGVEEEAHPGGFGDNSPWGIAPDGSGNSGARSSWEACPNRLVRALGQELQSR